MLAELPRLEPALIEPRKRALNADKLVDAAAAGEARQVRGMLARGRSSPNATRRDGTSPLYAAAARRANRGEMVTLLLHLGANPLQSVGGDLPLHVAAASGDAASILALASAAPQTLGMANARGYTALHVASACGLGGTARYLLALGAPISQEGPDAADALHLAAMSGNPDAVRALVTPFTTVDPADAHGSTPLHFAILSGSAESVAVLLREGANPLARHLGHPPLHLAVAQGDASMVTALLAAGADLAVHNPEGHSAAEYAVQCYKAARGTPEEAARRQVLSKLTWPCLARLQHGAYTAATRLWGA